MYLASVVEGVKFMGGGVFEQPDHIADSFHPHTPESIIAHVNYEVAQLHTHD